MNIELQPSPVRPGRMTSAQFRTFQNGRPDRERWELVAGVPMMMTPPTIAHNRIAGNLESLLNGALSRYLPDRLATQRPGVDLSSGDYRPEPDVAVIEADYEADQRFVDRAYLLAEVVSDTDEMRVPGTDKKWIDVKRAIYLEHPACEVVLIAEQDRMELRVDVKSEKGWTSTTLRGGDELHLAAFGLRCDVADLYEGTPLNPRPTPGRRLG
jgi:Uma2 family endonuclease